MGIKEWKEIDGKWNGDWNGEWKEAEGEWINMKTEYNGLKKGE